MITPEDLTVVAFLVFLEGVLSIDNALVLAMLARPLPPQLQRRALTYGLVGAIVFRLLALSLTTALLRWNWVKFVGGGYLIFIALKHFFGPKEESDEHGAGKGRAAANFWKTVLIIELTDIAFAVDSILAAVALSRKFWVVFTGGFLGVVAMRFAAKQFISLLNRFPNFESTAFLLVLLIGIKVILEGLHLPGIDFHSSQTPAFWIFWALMAICVALGFRRSAPAPRDGENGR